MQNEVILIPLDRIRIVNNRFRDRRKFEKIVESIRNHGLKKPIQVSPRSGGPADGQPDYDLVCGQGRIEAFKSLGYQEIPALVVEASKEDLMIMSLVENMARRFPAPGDLIVEIDRLKQAGYSNVAIGRKLDLADTMVGGLLSLRNAGEERLLAVAITGAIPLGVAIDISKAESPEAQRELLKAYEGGQLNQTSIKVVRRLMTQRRSLGKGLQSNNTRRKIPFATADGLVKAFKKESQRQRSLVRKAKICDAHLLFVTTAFRRLASDEDFTNLLRAEKLDTMPAFLAEKIGLERRVA
ncbi:MAG: ParB N-terminal domain-containing protein [Verrucomicrobia bacterium]|nr:ParB N-terminal domain-containing protein [Verrucomicrobiota bacterium]